MACDSLAHGRERLAAVLLALVVMSEREETAWLRTSRLHD